MNTNLKTSKIIVTMETAPILFVAALFPSLFSAVCCSPYAAHSYRGKAVSQDAMATLTEACVGSAGIRGEAQPLSPPPLSPPMSCSLSSLSTQFGGVKKYNTKVRYKLCSRGGQLQGGQNYLAAHTACPELPAMRLSGWARTAGPGRQLIQTLLVDVLHVRV